MAKKHKNSNYHQTSNAPELPSESRGGRRPIDPASKILLIVAAISLIVSYVASSKSTGATDAWAIASYFLMAVGAGGMSIVQRQVMAEKGGLLSKILFFILMMVACMYAVVGVMALTGGLNA